MGNKTLLLVEDNPDNQLLATWILEDADYEVVVADTGERCLELMSQKSFDLVLMDISLPGIDGTDATMELRSKEQFKDLPILALTAHAIEEERQKIMASGVNEILTKPLDEDLLLKRIAFYLRGA